MGLPGAPISHGWPLSSPQENASAPRELHVGKAALQPRVAGYGPKAITHSGRPLSHFVLSVSCQRSRGRLLPKSSLRKKRRENALPKARRQRWLQQRQRNLQVAKKKNTAR